LAPYSNNIKQKQEYQTQKIPLFKSVSSEPLNLTSSGISTEDERERIITAKIGSGPILKHFIERMGIARIIDSMVDTHPNREAITHGEAVAGLVAYLIQGGKALYRVEQWAQDYSVADIMFPQYQSEDWTDDRLGDTLDAIYVAGLEGIQGAISANIVSEFGISLNEIHYDTTTVSLYGVYETKDEDQAVVITYGHSKDHRPDLRQIKVGLAISGDGNVPLISNTHDGNTSDSVIPVDYWKRLKQIADTRNFVFIGDCKLASKSNMLDIAESGGFFLSLYPMDVAQKKYIRQKRLQGEMPFPFVEIETHSRKPTYEPITQSSSDEKEEDEDHYFVFEEITVLKDDDRECIVRKIYVLSESLSAQHEATREHHLSKAFSQLESLQKRLNKRDLTTQEAIEKSVSSILKRNKVQGLIDYSIVNKPIKKKKGRGRPGPDSEYIYEDHFSLEYSRNEQAIEYDALLDGMFVLICNMPLDLWPAKEVLSLYKCQWKVEGDIKTFKGPFAVSQMYLELPRRICAMMFIITLALQLYTLINREIANSLEARDKPLVGLMPNRIQSRRPQANFLLEAFKNIQLVSIELYDRTEIYVTSLNDLQKEILSLLGVSLYLYSKDAIIQHLYESEIKMKGG